MPETTDAIRVLLVDDDQMVVSGLRAILESAEDITVVGIAHDGREAIEQAHLHFPDIVLMDLRMPTMNGVEATRQLVNAVRPPKVVVLTGESSDDYLLSALDAGASGYLFKSIDPQDLAPAIGRAHGGESVLAPVALRSLIDTVTNGQRLQQSREAQERVAQLTPQELIIAKMVYQGLTNPQIAATTHTSIATVKSHLSKVNVKLDTNTRVGIALALERAMSHS